MKKCGVYKITNIITGEIYVGASVDITSMKSIHFGRAMRQYKDINRFYAEIYNFGRENFKHEILEICSRDVLLEREQFWYDFLKPTYNFIRPNKCNFLDEKVRNKSKEKQKENGHYENKKKLFRTPEYVEKFRKSKEYKMKSVIMLKDGIVIKEFKSMSDAARYISETTNFKGKNKVSKIKSVCDGERKSAYGYVFKYSKV